jgi:hypothetical protein
VSVEGVVTIVKALLLVSCLCLTNIKVVASPATKITERTMGTTTFIENNGFLTGAGTTGILSSMKLL